MRFVGWLFHDSDCRLCRESGRRVERLLARRGIQIRTLQSPDALQLLGPSGETNVFAQLIPGYATNREAVLRARSALYWPEKLNKRTPILLLPGSADWRVQPTDSLRMATALFEHKHPFRLVVFEGGDHGLSEHRQEVNRLVKAWLDDYVRDRKPGPNLEPHGR